MRKPEWSFYPAWILLTALCVPIAFLLDLIFIKTLLIFVGDYIYVDGVRHITEDYLFPYTFIPIVSLLIGIVQYRLLRRYLPRMGWWLLATISGWLGGFVLILGWGQIVTHWWSATAVPEPWAVALVFIVLGLCVGLGQWLLLRRRLPRAGWWIVANVVGWSLLFLINGKSIGLFELLTIGLLPASVTAVAFTWLMSQTSQSL
jgi:hypothetical protein